MQSAQWSFLHIYYVKTSHTICDNLQSAQIHHFLIPTHPTTEWPCGSPTRKLLLTWRHIWAHMSATTQPPWPTCLLNELHIVWNIRNIPLLRPSKYYCFLPPNHEVVQCVMFHTHPLLALCLNYPNSQTTHPSIPILSFFFVLWLKFVKSHHGHC